ncbi:MAG: enoyl-CoA hydratase/isomerase family protein [Deltaproteobacteria bacterium]|nr:enoyl-CoA hydratase/isomerase family protein [Deltaproteobacteria bacterium]
MSYKNLLVEVADGIAFVKINRPKALNALNRETLLELQQALKELQGKKDAQIIVLTGEGGKAFVAGADIAEMKDMNPTEALAFSRLGHETLGMIENFTKPVIAAVNGYALGGGLEIALSCDFIYVSETAKLGVPEVTLGIFPGFGGTQRLPRLIGKGRAKELIYTGKMIDAQEAYNQGIANKVFPADKLMEEVTQVARTIAQNGPMAVSMAKDAVNAGYDMGAEEGEVIEMTAWGNSFATHDQKEGMGAFLEKRKPQFKGE